MWPAEPGRKWGRALWPAKPVSTGFSRRQAAGFVGGNGQKPPQRTVHSVSQARTGAVMFCDVSNLIHRQRAAHHLPSEGTGGDRRLPKAARMYPHPFVFIEAHFIHAAIIELRRARRGVEDDLHGFTRIIQTHFAVGMRIQALPSDSLRSRSIVSCR